MSATPFILVILAIILAACGGGSRTERATLTPPPNRETLRNTPNWFNRPPRDDNFLIAPATAVSQDLQIAVDKAQAEGRNALAQQMEVKYGSLTKRFAEETGRMGDAQLLDQYTQVYKATVSQVLYGSRARQQVVRTEGPVYRVYVLMELPTGEMSRKLMEQMRANEQMYTRFRATEAFKELDAELQRYEAWKRSQPR